MIAIPNAQDRLILQFKGIWYYAFNVPNIEPFTWGTVCFSYTFKTHKIRLAYRGKIYLSKTDPELLGKRSLGENFLNNFILGRKDNIGSFTGKLSRFFIWGTAGSDKSLQDASDCSGTQDKRDLGKKYFKYFTFYF